MNEFDENLPEEVPDFDASRDEDESPIKRELLTVRLFKEAVKKAKGNEGDRIIENFADFAKASPHSTTSSERAFSGATITQSGAYCITSKNKPMSLHLCIKFNSWFRYHITRIKR